MVINKEIAKRLAREYRDEICEELSDKEFAEVLTEESPIDLASSVRNFMDDKGYRCLIRDVAMVEEELRKL